MYCIYQMYISYKTQKMKLKKKSSQESITISKIVKVRRKTEHPLLLKWYKICCTEQLPYFIDVIT